MMVLANGALMNRDAVIQSLDLAPPWRTYTIDDVRLIRSGSNSAVLVYRATAYRNLDDPAFVGSCRASTRGRMVIGAPCFTSRLRFHQPTDPFARPVTDPGGGDLQGPALTAVRPRAGSAIRRVHRCIVSHLRPA
jgi:hypothetical protein